MDWQTFRVIHDFAYGSDMDRQETAETNTIPRLPAPYYEGDSFRLELQCWQNKLASEYIDFGAAASAKLYITRYGVSQVPLELADGVLSEAVEGSGYNTITFDVPAEATDGYGGSDCLLYAVVSSLHMPGDDWLKRTISQRLTVTSLTGEGALNPDADEIPYTPAVPEDWTTEPETVAEALDELGARESGSNDDLLISPAGTTVLGKVYRNNAGAWLAGDPDDPECETCELFIALGTDPETDGMQAESLVTNPAWSWTTVGASLWLDDSGAITETVPTAETHAGRVARIVGWVRSATSIRFDGHVPGDTFEEAVS